MVSIMTNCLITKTGKVVECMPGAIHSAVCQHKLHTDLTTFLAKQSGCRVKMGWPETHDDKSIAIEFYRKLSAIQLQIIRSILRKDDYYTVVLVRETITRFRPIRTI